MKKIINHFKNKIKKDNAASATIEFIFALVFLLWISISFLDLGFYFLNKSTISNAAQNGARLVSVYGGSNGTPISDTYGETNSSCGPAASGLVACNVKSELENAPSVSLSINNITCAPDKTSRLGQRTWCEVDWTYPGLPGSAFTFLRTKNSIHNKTVMSAESEVVLD